MYMEAETTSIGSLAKEMGVEYHTVNNCLQRHKEELADQLTYTYNKKGRPQYLLSKIAKDIIIEKIKTESRGKYKTYKQRAKKDKLTDQEAHLSEFMLASDFAKLKGYKKKNFSVFCATSFNSLFEAQLIYKANGRIYVHPNVANWYTPKVLEEPKVE